MAYRQVFTRLVCDTISLLFWQFVSEEHIIAYPYRLAFLVAYLASAINTGLRNVM